MESRHQPRLRPRRELDPGQAPERKDNNLDCEKQWAAAWEEEVHCDTPQSHYWGGSNLRARVESISLQLELEETSSLSPASQGPASKLWNAVRKSWNSMRSVLPGVISNLKHFIIGSHHGVLTCPSASS